MLVTVGSVKGSPGATTLALLLAATWPQRSPGERPVVVEADCAGGDLGGRCWLPDSPGLTSLATAARTGHVAVTDHVARLPCGVDVVVAPASRQASTIAVGLLVETGFASRLAETGIASQLGENGFASWLTETGIASRVGDRTVIADVGRFDPGAPSSELVNAADAVVVVSPGDGASLLRLSDAALARETTQLVLVGTCAYSSQEVAEGVGLPVAAVLPWDPRAARTVWGVDDPGRAWTRRGLPAAVRALAERLAAHGERLAVRAADAAATSAGDNRTPDRGRHSTDLTGSPAPTGLAATSSLPGTRP